MSGFSPGRPLPEQRGGSGRDESCGCRDGSACRGGWIKVIAAFGRAIRLGGVDLPAPAGDTNPFLRLSFPGSPTSPCVTDGYKPVG